MSNETRTIAVTLTQEQDFAFKVKFDDKAYAELLTDEAAPLGQDQGPGPSSLLLAAVANCLSASLLFALRKFKNQTGPLVTHATATIGRNSEGRIRILGIDVRLHLDESLADLNAGERLLAQFEQFCTVTESVRAGVPVSVSVTDGSGSTVHATTQA